MSVEPKQPPQCFFSGHGASRQKGNQTSSHVRISDQPKLATSDPPPRRRQVGQSSRAKIFPSGLQKYSTQRFLPLGMGKSCFLTDSPRHEQTGVRKYLSRSSSCFPCSPCRRPDRMPLSSVYPARHAIAVTDVRAGLWFFGTSGSTGDSARRRAYVATPPQASRHSRRGRPPG
jgi:hypothetical protein